MLGVEPVLEVVAVLAAALFKDLKGPIADPAWRGLGSRCRSDDGGGLIGLGGRGLRGDNDNLVQLGLFLDF